MTLLTIDTDNNADLAKAKLVAKQNGWILKQNSTTKKSLPKSNSKKLSSFLQEFAKSGGATSFTKNPLAWQIKTRKDKKLVGR